MSQKDDRRFWRNEWPLFVVWPSAALWLIYGDAWVGHHQSLAPSLFSLLWIAAAILCAAFAVVRHADALAERFGEPYGTMILTIAVISLEVLMISALMLHSDQPTLARDTMYSVVMIVLTALVGFCLVAGGLKFHEQSFNLQGANSYLAMILPLAVIGLVLPIFTKSGIRGGYSATHAAGLVVLSLAIYGVFLLVQTNRHRDFFRDPEGDANDGHVGRPSPLSNAAHTALLFAYIAPVVLLAKKLAVVLHYASNDLGLPEGFSGFIVASLLLAPEGLAAIEAALQNRMQRSINLLLGSVLATIGLTIPAALAIGLITGKTVILGLDNAEVVLLLIVQAVCILTFGQGRTNMLHGAIHLLLFGVYIFLIFDTGT
ncbi:MAG: calcium:proton antiporter [Chthoniobacterales bacterium]|nr:calcium:proton antiporter [Chthoniobacterales bacterium]